MEKIKWNGDFREPLWFRNEKIAYSREGNSFVSMIKTCAYCIESDVGCGYMSCPVFENLEVCIADIRGMSSQIDKQIQKEFEEHFNDSCT